MKKAELLIPVSNMDTLYAAINAGADAVYLAYKKFGARAYADNFTETELIDVIKICHLYKVNVYVTFNTMIYNNEIDEALRIIKMLYINHVDAIIMQDNGLIKLVRKLMPDLNIHVSTQAHNHNYEGVSYYEKIGCTRIIFDRESSLDAINNMDLKIEKEIFVHGALCVCYSGNCLFSALNGGRSANRGMCVGSCRMPYKLEINNKLHEKKYYLSTKDLNTTDYLKNILDLNIDSLKVEGRMKSKEYVYLVTSIYRKLIDDYYLGKELFITNEEKNNLLKTYNREFTKGYLFNSENIINNKTSNHQGVTIGKVIGVNNKRITIMLNDNLHQEDAIRFSKINKGMYVNLLYDKNGLLQQEILKGNICQIDNKDRIMYDDLIGSDVLKTIDYLLNKELNNIDNKKIPIRMMFKARINEPLYLKVDNNVHTAEVSYSQAQEALKLSVNEEKIKEQLSKLGNTIYYLDNIDIDIEDNLFINLKDLNEIRRLAIEKLNNMSSKPIEEFDLKVPFCSLNKASSFKYSILVRNEEQLKIALKNKMDFIYVTDKDLYDKYKTYQNIYYRLSRVNENMEPLKGERLLCTELGSIVKYGQDNIIHTDYTMNIVNDYSMDVYDSLNSKINTLSIEMDIDTIKEIKKQNEAEIILYGRPELMIIKNNIFNLNDNDKCYLIDDKNNRYPVMFRNNLTYVIHSKVLNRIKDKKYLNGFSVLRIDLFDENIIETQKIIDEIKK